MESEGRILKKGIKAIAFNGRGVQSRKGIGRRDDEEKESECNGTLD